MYSDIGFIRVKRSKLMEHRPNILSIHKCDSLSNDKSKLSANCADLDFRILKLHSDTCIVFVWMESSIWKFCSNIHKIVVLHIGVPVYLLPRRPPPSISGALYPGVDAPHPHPPGHFKMHCLTRKFIISIFAFRDMDIRPNHTIYINNLNEKIKKDGEYRNDPKFLDRYVWANSADPDQTASRRAIWSGSTLFAIPSASFGFITLW